MTRPRRAFPTRIDRFRVENDIAPVDWARAAGMRVSMLLRIRAGADVDVDTVARLVRSAARITGKVVRPSDLYDFGEETELPSRREASKSRKRRNDQRRVFDTPLDRILIEEDLAPGPFARDAGLTRQWLRRIRAGLNKPSVGTLAKIVRALRRGTAKPYTASDLYDLGEE